MPLVGSALVVGSLSVEVRASLWEAAGEKGREGGMVDRLM